MFEVTTTYTRNNTNVEFFVFQIDDLPLLKAQSQFRQEMLEAPGFVGLYYFLSENKLELNVQALWESQSLLVEFSNKSTHKDKFLYYLKQYHEKTNISASIETSVTFDPKYLKDKKISNRLTVPEAQNRLIDFLSNKR